jgi:hypothetical protein
VTSTTISYPAKHPTRSVSRLIGTRNAPASVVAGCRAGGIGGSTQAAQVARDVTLIERG